MNPASKGRHGEKRISFVWQALLGRLTHVTYHKTDL